MRNSTIEMEQDWDGVWKRDGVLLNIVSAARNFYALLFKRLLLRYCNSHTKVIEFGCGSVSVGTILISHIFSYHGLDISPLIINASQHNDIVKKNRGKFFFTVGDCRYPDEALRNVFDVSWSHGLIEHFNDPFQVVQSHINTTKHGGIVIISVPYKYSVHKIWYLVTRFKILRRFWPWTEQIFFSRKDLKTLGEQSDLPFRVFFLPPFPLGFILGLVILEIHKI